MFSGKKITLIVTGSIAAYKSAYLLRELVKNNATVRVVMTKAACEFISPLTMQTLSGSIVGTELFDHYQEAQIGHIDLADNADLILVAPATANIIAKAANGMADDLASTILLASKAKKLFVPSMNVNMWENEITQENVKKLKKFGIDILNPENGELACGWVGAGRFAETNKIIDKVSILLGSSELKGKKVIVTAGPTVESIDPVRFVSNRSTGKMGYAITKVALSLGAEVDLISGPCSLEIPEGLNFFQVETAKEMKKQVLESLKETKQKYLFMAAAVTDHRPANSSKEKVKNDKSKNYNLEMEPCDDILKAVAQSKDSKTKIIGFCVETGDEESLKRLAKQKLRNKNCDLIVANLANDSFAKDTNKVFLISAEDKIIEVPTASKSEVAKKIINQVLSKESS